MITEYPLEHRRYGGSEYELFWAAAEALDLPLSLHTATRRLTSLHRLRRDGAGEAPQFSRASSGARNSRNTGDHLACSAPLEEWPRSLSSSK